MERLTMKKWTKPPANPATGTPYSAINKSTYDLLSPELRPLYEWNESINAYLYIKETSNEHLKT